MISDKIKETLKDMVSSFCISQCLYVVTKLEIVSFLQDGAKTCDELAQLTNSQVDVLYRVMRTLVSFGIFEEAKERFALTTMGEALATNTIKSEILHVLHPSSWNSWGELFYSVKTGKAAFPHVFGKSAWEYRSEHPELSEIFNAMTTAQSDDESNIIMDHFDFSKTEQIIDIGGGEGQLLMKILSRYQHLRGILFEQPHVAEKAKKFWESMNERCDVISGNFLDNVPAYGDVYILKAIVHNWNDAAVITILTNCRRVMAKNARLLLLERVLEEHVSLSSNFIDLHMLVIHGSKERTKKEFSSLLNHSGFQLDKISRISKNLCLIESFPI